MAVNLRVRRFDDWCPIRPNGTPSPISFPPTNWLHFGAYGKPWSLDTAIGHARYHIETKGWQTVGYSALVVLTPEPSLLLGRVLQRGAHTIGYNDGAGICVPGNVLSVPELGVEAIAEALRIGAAEGWWPARFDGGHRDVANKGCPGNALYARIPEINARAAGKPAPEPEPDEPEDDDMAVTHVWTGTSPDGDHGKWKVDFITTDDGYAGTYRALVGKEATVFQDRADRKVPGFAKSDLEAQADWFIGLKRVERRA